MNASYYLRSDKNSTGEVENRIGVLSAGSEFKVLKKAGNALEIEITKLSKTSNVQKSQSIWIYKGNESHFTDISGSTNIETEAQNVSAPCKGCNEVAAREPPLKQKNTAAIQSVAREIVTATNQPPPEVLPPAKISTPENESATNVVNSELDGKIKNYSQSSQVAMTLKWAENNNGMFSLRRCYRQVKMALLAKDKLGKSLISAHYSDEAAIGAKESLKKYGFTNLMDIEPYKSKMLTPSDAPKGAVLVYSSGRRCPGRSNIKDCGHIEIKTGEKGEPGYISDYKSKYAINETPAAKKFGSKYELIGIMIKPMENP